MAAESNQCRAAQHPPAVGQKGLSCMQGVSGPYCTLLPCQALCILVGSPRNTQAGSNLRISFYY